MRIGFAEAAVVLLAAVVFIGPEKLPDYAKKCGKALADFRRAYREAAGVFSGEAGVEKHEKTER